MRKLAASATLAVLVLAGCTPVEPLPGVPTGKCTTAGLANLVGRDASAGLVSRARRRAGASVARVLRPGQIVTMEFRDGRLNVNVDSQNRVRNFTCG